MVIVVVVVGGLGDCGFCFGCYWWLWWWLHCYCDCCPMIVVAGCSVLGLGLDLGLWVLKKRDMREERERGLVLYLFY